MSSRKQRGYDTQRIAAARLREAGWVYAEPVGAGRPGSDVTGVVGIDLEVKARRGLDLPGWMRQTANRTTGLPMLLVRPDGFGPATVDLWPAIFPFGRAIDLLKDAGYQ